jgi:hypothetical protein
MRGGRRLGAVAVLVTGLVAVVMSGPALAQSGPSVTSISLDAGLTTGGVSVTISGAGFTGTTAVDFGSVPGSSVVVQSDNTLTVKSPAEPAGTVDVTVVTPQGTSGTSSADQFTVVAPGSAPTVTSVSPTSGTNDGGTTLTLTGTGFVGVTSVEFETEAGFSLDVLSPTSLTVVTPPYPAGSVEVSVETPNGPAQTTFIFVTPGPPPTVTGVSPSVGLTSGTVVTITGTGFAGVNSVSFGGVAAASFLVSSTTTIVAQSPVEAAGTVDVTVTTPNGTSATSSADQFTGVAPGPPPAVTSVTPNAGTTAGGVTFTITGTGFTGATAVNVGPTAASFVFSSDTSITATSPTEAAGTYDVTVTTPNGTSPPNPSGDQFTVVAPLPVVSSVGPSSGTTDGGTSVTISGSGFTFATAVAFGVTAATSFVVNSDTSITATSPAESPSSVDITVTTAGGTSATSAADQYTFVLPPLVVTSLSPTSGSTLGGTTVTITGSRFIGASAVDFGTVSASFNFVSDTEITAISPTALKVGNVDVTVVGPTGTTPVTRLADRFTYVLPAQINSVKPSSGSFVGGTSVTVRGKRFTNVTAVDFGATAASMFTVDSGGAISATTPPGLPGPVDVTVTTGTGTTAVSATDQFTYTTPPPVVASVSVPGVAPAGGSTAGGTPVTITGTGFTGAYAVDFGSVPATAMVVTGDGTITATSPPGVVGPVNVYVTTAHGTSRKSPDDVFTYVMRVTVPVVTGLSPHAGFTNGKTSGQPLSIAITGTGFTGATVVDFDTDDPSPTPAPVVSVLSDTSIVVQSPAISATLAGTYDVTVTTPDGTSATSAADLFSFVTPGPPAAVTGVSPTSGPDTGGTNVVITGSDLSEATAVDFGSVSVPFTLDEFAGELVATSPPEAVGTVDVTVTTPNGVSVTNSRDKFSFTEPQIPPTVTSVHPPDGPTTGGTAVTIHGTGFVGAAGVEFGDIPVTFVVDSDRTITATSPAENAGTVDITVTTSNGTSLTGPSDEFTFKAPRAGRSTASGPVQGRRVGARRGAGATAVAVRAGPLH